MRTAARRFVIAAAWLAAGCSGIHGTYPRDTPIIPAAAISLTQSTVVTLEQIAHGALLLGAAYLILDPMAPNWRIEEFQLATDTYALNLRMKRVFTGGQGEARQVFHRRAAALARANGYEGYEVLSYSEGIDSALVPQRVGEGVVKLVAAAQPQQ